MFKLGLVWVLGVVCLGCAIGAPPGFSAGDLWTFPLVDPLDDGKLLTPLYIEGKGPFLCAIDPDAPTSVIDSELIARFGFVARPGPRFVDEHDTSHPTFYATATNLRIGDLSLSQRNVVVGANGSFNSKRRRIYGVIGRDIIVDSLVFGFDRERGIAWLETEQAFKPPSGAQVIDYFKGPRRRSDLVVRRLVSANVDGKSYDLHLDLGDVASQLRPEHWSETKLHTVPLAMTVIDEIGTHRDVTNAGIADRVTAAGVTREHLGFIAYDDRRWDFGELEGTLGLDFFRPFSVIADWHNLRYYLTPRQDRPLETAGRLARWGVAVPVACAASGCVTLSIGAEPARSIARVERDPGAEGVELEVSYRAIGDDGTELPRLYVSLRAKSNEISSPLDVRYARAKLVLLDVSPFPFHCDGCIVSD